MASLDGSAVATWLSSIGLAEWTNHFIEFGYDELEVCAELTEEDLDSMEITLLDVRRQLLVGARSLCDRARHTESEAPLAALLSNPAKIGADDVGIDSSSSESDDNDDDDDGMVVMDSVAHKYTHMTRAGNDSTGAARPKPRSLSSISTGSRRHSCPPRSDSEPDLDRYTPSPSMRVSMGAADTLDANDPASIAAAVLNDLHRGDEVEEEDDDKDSSPPELPPKSSKKPLVPERKATPGGSAAPKPTSESTGTPSTAHSTTTVAASPVAKTTTPTSGRPVSIATGPVAPPRLKRHTTLPSRQMAAALKGPTGQQAPVVASMMERRSKALDDEEAPNAAIEPPKELCGFLTKQGGPNNNKGWKRRWCTYSDGNLRYFRSSTDAEPAGIISQHIMIEVQRSRSIDPRYPFSFELFTARKRVYMFATDSEVAMKDWMNTLQQAMAFCRAHKKEFVRGGAMAEPDKEGSMAFGGAMLVTEKKSRLIGSWPRRYVVVKGSQICYYRSKDDYEAVSPLATISAMMASAKSDKNRVVIDTNKWRYVFKTDSVQDAEAWVRAIQASIQLAFNEYNETGSQPEGTSNKVTMASAGGGASGTGGSGGGGGASTRAVRVVSSAVIGSTPGLALSFSASPSSSLTNTVTSETGDGGGSSFESDASEAANAAADAVSSATAASTTASGSVAASIQLPLKKHSRNASLTAATGTRESFDGNDAAETKMMLGSEAWEAIRQNRANHYCADCNALDPDWASINLGIPLCIECSGIHRALGVHRSKVRSIKLDKWTPSLVRLMVAMGTSNSNEFWEGNCGEGYSKPMGDSRRTVREEYIRAKYERGEFCSRARLADPDTMGAALLEAAATDDLMHTVELLALGADVNYMGGCTERHPWSHTPLHVAASEGKELQVQVLLLNGAFPTLADENGCPPLHYADINEHLEVCEVLERTITRQVTQDSTVEQPRVTAQARRGYLWKQGGANNNKGWRRRWFVFEGSSLRYYRSESDREPAGSLYTRDITGVATADEENGKDPRFRNCFELYTCSPRDYLLCAESEEDATGWMDALRSVVPDSTLQPKKGSNLLDMLETADKRGVLYKRGGSFTAWKRRYFVLRGKDLYYFRSKDDMEVLGVISLKKVTVIAIGEGGRGKNASSGRGGLSTGTGMTSTTAVETQFAFHIVTPTRTYYLHAESEEDSHEWIDALKNTQVFGIALETAARGLPVPAVVTSCVDFLEKVGLDKEGIYRVPGNTAKINGLRIKINQDETQVSFEAEYADRVHDVAGLLKLFFRSLPDPLLTRKLYPHFIQASRLPDHDSRLTALQHTISSLPPVNYETLKRLIYHLTLVAQMGSVNKMTEQNLAIVFGPTLMTVEQGEQTSLGDMSEQYRVVEHLLTYYNWMFQVDEDEPDLKEVAAITEGMDADTAARVAEAMRKMEQAAREHRQSQATPSGPGATPSAGGAAMMHGMGSGKSMSDAIGALTGGGAGGPGGGMAGGGAGRVATLQMEVGVAGVATVSVSITSSTTAKQLAEAAIDAALVEHPMVCGNRDTVEDWGLFESLNGGEFERVMNDDENILRVTSAWSVGGGLNSFLIQKDKSWKSYRHLEDRNDIGFSKRGVLYKEGGKVKAWRSRFFVTGNSRLTYFTKQDDKKECGNFSMRGMTMYTVGAGYKKTQPTPYCFAVRHFTAATNTVETRYLCAETEHEMYEWIAACRFLSRHMLNMPAGVGSA